MDILDFLESKHNMKLNYTSEKWNAVYDIIETLPLEIKTLKKTDDLIKVNISRKLFDTVLVVEKTKEEIVFKIGKKGILNLVPDNAQNYSTLKRIVKEIAATN